MFRLQFNGKKCGGCIRQVAHLPGMPKLQNFHFGVAYATRTCIYSCTVTLAEKTYKLILLCGLQRKFHIKLTDLVTFLCPADDLGKKGRDLRCDTTLNAVSHFHIASTLEALHKMYAPN